MQHQDKPRIIYNDDSSSINYAEPPFTKEKVGAALDYLEGSQVDCLCWKVYRRFTAGWSSKVCQTMYELYEKENPDKSVAADNLRMELYRQGVDYLPILIEEAQTRKIQFFASFRMNDCHHRSMPSSAADFWKNHQHYRLWEVTDGYTYYNAALDYSYPEVRQRISEVILEFARMYDVDGIELDFYRNPYIFQPSEAWSKRQILTDFVKDLRTQINDIGRRKGRRIALLARVPFAEDRFSKAGENRLMLAGMDVETWVKEQYIDILVMTFGTNRFNQQVQPWNRLSRENNVLFYPCIELSSATNAAHNFVARETPEVTIRRQRAMAQNFLAQDVDGVYMFNYPCLLFGTRWDQATFNRMAGILAELGTLHTLKDKPKQYTFWENLPITIETNRPPQYHQTITFHINDPDIQSSRTRVRLSFRQTTERNPHAKGQFEQSPTVPPGWVTYILNGRDIEADCIRHTMQPGDQLQSGLDVADHELIEISLPSGTIVNGENTLGFYVGRFPEERDPYIKIYELTADTEPSSAYGDQQRGLPGPLAEDESHRSHGRPDVCTGAVQRRPGVSPAV